MPRRPIPGVCGITATASGRLHLLLGVANRVSVADRLAIAGLLGTLPERHDYPIAPVGGTP